MNTHKGTLGRGTNNQPSGDHSAEDPPVPIPNTAVKLRSADDTPAPGRGKVGHRQILQDDRPAHKGGPIGVLGHFPKFRNHPETARAGRPATEKSAPKSQDGHAILKNAMGHFPKFRNQPETARARRPRHKKACPNLNMVTPF